ncbi:hypothetical protein N8I74_13285 [Chitiniphilus purpureus]|uniref:Uncharacterized protein n=1 Tax=Chitiniphilus purpureus TaxID=2981137 RepID=A0ABY6DIV0_9NEIS|nr:hypothetical protein [Chitiniphilus sp. CD1]UXY14284.1 hypothetical protein N8I74_13285 [Chitiniphilus sp. CD1]
MTQDRHLSPPVPGTPLMSLLGLYLGALKGLLSKHKQTGDIPCTECLAFDAMQQKIVTPGRQNM